MTDLSDMNEAQRMAVTHGEGPLLLLAGPGSGKTFTITRRILYLLERGVPPEEILVITFTREAAESMQRRFRQMCPVFYPVNFGTFHSVFFHMLQKSNILKSTEILTNYEKKNMILPILKKYGGRADGEVSQDDLKEDADVILAAVSFYKNTLKADEALGKVPTRWRQDFLQIFKDYERTALTCGRLDFDDMLCRCRQLLIEDSAFSRTWQGRFIHILIDEFQDVNPVQYEVVKILAGERRNIFAVGDDDQSIYGFRGSAPECLKRFEREYGARSLLLDVNYRSHPDIVHASLSVIADNKDRFFKDLRPDPARAEGTGLGRVNLSAFGDKEEQYAYLLKRLADFTPENTPEGGKECAVLFRTNTRMQGLAVKLRAAGIPYAMKEKMQSIYEHFIAKDITAYLRLAAGEWERESVLRVVNRPSRYVSREAVAGVRSIEELQAYYEKADLDTGRKSKTLKSLNVFLRQMKALGRLSPGLGVTYIQKAVGYETYLRETAGRNAEKIEEWLEMLEWLKADAGQFGSVGEWCRAQEAHTESLKNQGKRKADDGNKKASVCLMTVHGAKGLEFDTVIIPDCNETTFPHGHLQAAAEVEEERRIFYVAMTRAKENLELLYLAGEKERSRPPSRFLNPLI